MALSALQAQNTVTVGDVELKKGNSALVSVELTNELAFSAFQMDLTLPEGFSIPITMNEDEEEVLDITLNASRKKSSHQLVYNVLDNGNVRIGSYSNTNATLKGTSGEIIQFRIVATDEVETGTYTARLSQLLFSTADPAVEYDLGTVDFQIAYEGDAVDIEPVEPKRSVEVNAGQYGRCVFEGEVIEPNGSYTLSEEFEDGASIQLFFVPFKGYAASTMTRNGEVVAIQDNMYEETVKGDVAFTEVNYVRLSEEIEELPEPIITFDAGEVSIECERDDVTILYAINGNPLEGDVYVEPFTVPERSVVSAVAVRVSKVAELTIIASDMEESPKRVAARRYYKENGIRVASAEEGVTIVVDEYEDGSMQAYKVVGN